MKIVNGQFARRKAFNRIRPPSGWGRGAVNCTEITIFNTLRNATHHAIEHPHTHPMAMCEVVVDHMFFFVVFVFKFGRSQIPFVRNSIQENSFENN